MDANEIINSDKYKQLKQSGILTRSQSEEQEECNNVFHLYDVIERICVCVCVGVSKRNQNRENRFVIISKSYT